MTANRIPTCPPARSTTGRKAMARRVRAVRRRLGVTQQVLARRLGVRVLQVNRWERGKQVPRLERQVEILEMEARYGLR